MAITPKFYGLGMKNVTTGAIDLDTDTFVLTLHTSTYTPNQDTDDFFNDATNEISGGGYAAQTLASVAVTYDATSQQVRIDWADPVFSFSSAKTFRYGVIHKSRGGASSADELLAYLDWGADQTVSTTYTLQLAAAGLLYIDVT